MRTYKQHEIISTIQKYLAWFLAIALLISGLYLGSNTRTEILTSILSIPGFMENTPNTTRLHPANSLEFQEILKPEHLIQANYSFPFLTNSIKPPAKSFLCRLNLDTYCMSTEVADVIDLFWVVCPVYAPYQTLLKIRYELHKYYAAYIRSFGLPFSTVEAIRPDRYQDYLLTEAGKEPYDIQLYIYDDGYLRENLLNVAAQKIPGWEYMAWIDTHQPFENPYWWEESIVRMEKYKSVQLFQNLQGFREENITKVFFPSALYMSIYQGALISKPGYFMGNAYGIKKEVYDGIKFIFDLCIGGCCDCAYVKASIPKDFPFPFFEYWQKYTQQMLPWIEEAGKVFNGSRNIVRGILYHIAHEETFPYMSIMGIIRDSDFEAQKDLERDANSTLKLVNPTLKWKIQGIVFLWCFYKPLIFAGVVLGLLALYILYSCYKKREARKLWNFKKHQIK